MTASITLAIPQWTLGDRLRKAREHAGLEQGELADRIGISRSTVSNYELGRGVRPPKVVVLRAWAHECGVPYEWLTAGLPTPDAQTASNRGLVTTDGGYVFESNVAGPDPFWDEDLATAGSLAA